ncbi:MAG: MGMT family protein [Clostridia bacterium]|nr:MGMT family protein [Clostridia bacterium]
MDFYKRVGITVRAVPEGKVATYGQIALLCGKPKNARQVGYTLNRGLAGEVPAHRVVNSQGYLTGAASFEHPDLQRMLLEEEEVLVSTEGRVDMKRDGWKNTLEDALRLKEMFEREGI